MVWAEAARLAALQDGQDMAKIVIYAKAKLGELIRDLPSPKGSKIGRRAVLCAAERDEGLIWEAIEL